MHVYLNLRMRERANAYVNVQMCLCVNMFV
jgi:hypothetical protein